VTTLDRAIERYDAVSSYRVGIRSSGASGEQVLRYAFRKGGAVRVEMIRPREGALLVYDPQAGRVRLWPRGLHHFPELALRPDHPLILGASGQRIDHSDIGVLFAGVRALAAQGEAGEAVEVDAQGRTLARLDVTGAPGASVGGVHRYELWLEAERLLPLKVVSHDLAGRVIETVLMDDWDIDPPLPEAFFHPD
jgi:outer membrane lipoprotein-sorting protein